LQAIEAAGYRPGDEVCWPSIRPRADSTATAPTVSPAGRTLDAAGLVAYWTDLVRRYPIVSIEDGMAETIGRVGACSRRSSAAVFNSSATMS
jgi:enolase